MNTNTIAAYSGGALPGAIGICRISGENTFEIMDKLFAPKSGKRISEPPYTRMIYGDVIDFDGRTLDICLAVLYKAPHTYTGENMAEIFCHGSAAIVSAILERAYRLGARPAEAGEFTKRGFMAGKLDLTGAEAVADLIYAKSAAAAKNASAQLKGGISSKIQAMHSDIMGIITHYYAVCDYPDEDIDSFLCDAAAEKLNEITQSLEILYAGFQRGRTLVNGVPVTILGKPNVGKSSLLNALAGRQRAIVTAEAGTTRDIITEEIMCGGVLLRLSDTAGVRDAENEAEKIGVEMAQESATDSAAVICVFDVSRPFTEQDSKIIEISTGKNRIAVLNKCDLATEIPAEIEQNFQNIFQISAKTGEGIAELAAWLQTLDGITDSTEVLVTSARQAELLRDAAHSCQLAAQSAAQGMTADAFLADAEHAASLLSAVLGNTVSDDIVHGIFSRFCVGK